MRLERTLTQQCPPIHSNRDSVGFNCLNGRLNHHTKLFSPQKVHVRMHESFCKKFIFNYKQKLSIPGEVNMRWTTIRSLQKDNIQTLNTCIYTSDTDNHIHHITNCRQNTYTKPVHNRTLTKSQRSDSRDPLCRSIVEQKLRTDGAVLSADPPDQHPAG